MLSQGAGDSSEVTSDRRVDNMLKTMDSIDKG